MRAEERFQEVTRRVRDLLDCGAATLLLGCPDAGLRHPLLDMLPLDQRSYSGYYGSADVEILLQYETIRALCDLAVQVGKGQYFDLARWFITQRTIQSVALVPLERPAGVLGLFFITDPRQDVFSAGMRVLLEMYLHTLARELEQELRVLTRTSRRAYCAMPNRGSASVALLTPRQEELGRLKNEFVSMVSHELRSPLTAIKGYAALLQAYGLQGVQSVPEVDVEALTRDIQQQYLDIIMEQANHLEVLASDLLDISRIDADRLALRCAPVDLSLLCRQVVQLVQTRVDQSQAGKYYIRCMFDPDIPLAWADGDRVRQVLNNLLENAIKYSPAGGLIEMYVRLPRASQLVAEHAQSSGQRVSQLNVPGVIQIIVRDHGIGIAPAQQSRLFKPFTRLEHPATSHVPGAGLGLYITRKLVEAMDGTITLSSIEGEGTHVTFTLPTRTVS